MSNQKVAVLKGNVYLEVDVTQVDRYRKLGYSILDDKGRVSEEPLTSDPTALQAKVVELTKELNALKAELKKVKAENTRLKKATE